MMGHRLRGGLGQSLGFALVALLAVGCNDQLPSDSSFYSERVGPTLEFGCVQQTTGCHVASEDGTATGNLDLSSFDALMRREDVLPAYGPYPVGLLLLKGGRDRDVTIDTFDPHPDTGERVVSLTTDIRHNAGSGISLDSHGYGELKRWIEAGFTRSGVPPEELSNSTGECKSGIKRTLGFDPDEAPPSGVFDEFVNDVQPVLQNTCAGGNCHGTKFFDLYLACGDNERERRWNFFAAVQHVSDPVTSSELLNRPLDTLRGGTYHEGGDVFASPDDEGYQKIRSWAERVVDEQPELLVPDVEDEGLRYFANRVQPVLVKKGCMFLNCHSPTMGHDLRLRGGSQGTFSRLATIHNYEISKNMLATESPNPNDSRIIAKNLYRRTDVDGGEGIAHRGGALFEDFGGGGGSLDRATPEDCMGVDADAGDLDEVPAYCVLARWHEIERDNGIDEGELDDMALQKVVWVSRPTGVGDIRDFDTFRGGADLRVADASADGSGGITLGASSSMLGDCGLSGDVDVRTPAVSWNGNRIAFAARTGESEPLRLYWMRADGSECEPIPGIAPDEDRVGNILTHDFDPAFAPNGELVFASTRGNIAGPDYGGPTRTPAEMQPNANIYKLDPDSGEIQQMTFLLNQELAPSFMLDGRLIMTAEKRQPQFHQLALRRQNLDGSDYHPLFAQRGTVGFNAATEVVELTDRNFAFIAGPVGATDGAGTVVVVNRSIGPDQDDRDSGDRAYLHSMTLPVPGAFGRIQDVPVMDNRSEGAFRSPAALPTGRLLVSCDLGATDLMGGPFEFQLCEMDPDTGDVREIGGEPGRANVEAVAVYARPHNEHLLLQAHQDEPNGAGFLRDERKSVVHVLDFGVLEPLLFRNTRTGLRIDPEVGGFDVLEVRPPPRDATSFADVSGDVQEDEHGQVYVSYRELGHVPLENDGSARFSFPGGTPILLRVTDGSGETMQFLEQDPFEGDRIQKEQMQFYPGEHIKQGFRREQFNGVCAMCHGAISDRELDAAVDVDVLTSASQTQSRGKPPLDLSP